MALAGECLGSFRAWIREDPYWSIPAITKRRDDHIRVLRGLIVECVSEARIKDAVRDAAAEMKTLKAVSPPCYMETLMTFVAYQATPKTFESVANLRLRLLVSPD